MAGPSATPPSTKLIQPKTRRGRRALEKRAPKLVEDAKKVLLLFGNNTSQVVKDVVSDLRTLKGVDAVKFTKKNPDVQPFEPGGEASLERFCQKANCSLVVLGNHTKKRPHNLVLGRLYDHHLLDALEVGVQEFKSIKDVGGGQGAQVGNKPCIVFAGDRFETVPELRLLKSLLTDLFRGPQVDNINLAGVDRVVAAYAVDDKTAVLRQYCLKYKKSGSQVPRASLQDMGPFLNLSVRRTRFAAPDVEKEALRQPKLTNKVKNVGTTPLEGKVGRVYVPKQDMDTIALAKMKGLKRERRKAAEHAAGAKPAKKAKAAAADDA